MRFLPSADVITQLNGIQGLLEQTGQLGLGSNETDAIRVCRRRVRARGTLRTPPYHSQ